MQSPRFGVPAALLALALLLPLAACEKEGIQTTHYVTLTVPNYVPRAAVADSVGMAPAREICTPGNIYARGALLLVNEVGEGWHLIDNTDPGAPRIEAFWQVPGASQLAFVGARVVTNRYGDLVAAEFDGAGGLRVVAEAADAFASRYGFPSYPDSVIVGYREVTQAFTYDEGNGVWGCGWGAFDAAAQSLGWRGGFARGLSENADLAFADSRDALGAGAPDFTASGSLSRFTSYGEHVYAVTDSRLSAFRLADTIAKIDLEASPDPYRYYIWDAETAVVTDAVLYIGTPTGMHVFTLDDPSYPTFASTYTHTRGCDPVAVEGNRAAVTVRDGRECRSERDVNRLYILDVTDPQTPRELSRTPMRHPHGVAIDGDRLFVCDGAHGFRAYAFTGQRTAPGALLLDSPAPSTDVIVLPYASGTTVLTVSAEALVQYGDDPTGALAHLSTIKLGGCR